MLFSYEYPHLSYDKLQRVGKVLNEKGFNLTYRCKSGDTNITVVNIVPQDEQDIDTITAFNLGVMFGSLINNPLI